MTVSSSPIRIGLPAMPLEKGRSGIGVYIRNLVRLLSRNPEIDLIVYGFESDNYLLDIGPNGAFKAVAKRWESVSANLVWHALRLPILASLDRLDILFLPAGNRRMVMRFPGLPFRVAATVHDLAQFHLPQKYDRLRTAYIKNILPVSWRHSTVIVAPSHSTARDLKQFAGVSEEKISVVYNGASHAAFEPARNSEDAKAAAIKLGLPFPYILYVARIEHPGKNHVGLIKGYAKLREKHPDLQHHLVFVGADWNGLEVAKGVCNRLQLDSLVHFAGSVTAEDLPIYYRGADIFAFPSLFEGFGIPAIEAMACALPVIAANRASLPELVENIGVMFDPADDSDMARALEIGLFDKEFRKRAKIQGPVFAAEFTWERTAKDMLSVFRNL